MIWPENGKKEIIFTNNFSPIINIKTPVLNINNNNQETENNQNNIYKIKSNRKKFIKKKRLKNNDITNKKRKMKDTKNTNSKALFNIETKGEEINDKNKKPEIEKEIILSQNYEELQDMDYEQAIIYDKRNFLKYIGHS